MPTLPADLVGRPLYHPQGWLSEEDDRWRFYTGSTGTRQVLRRLRSCGFSVQRNSDGTYWFLKANVRKYKRAIVPKARNTLIARRNSETTARRFDESEKMLHYAAMALLSEHGDLADLYRRNAAINIRGYFLTGRAFPIGLRCDIQALDQAIEESRHGTKPHTTRRVVKKNLESETKFNRQR